MDGWGTAGAHSEPFLRCEAFSRHNRTPARRFRLGQDVSNVGLTLLADRSKWHHLFGEEVIR